MINPVARRQMGEAISDAPEALPSHRQVLTIGYGQSGAVKCSVNANPKPGLFTWSKNGHFITTSTEVSYISRQFDGIV